MRSCLLFVGLSGVLACARPHAPPGLVPEALWASGPRGGPVQDVVYTTPGELPRLEYVEGTLPLRTTSVKAHLRGPVAEVVVTQRFVNDRPIALEAIYTFPLPENSAVDRMRMVVGERVIEAEIRERGEARRVYVDAAAAGKTAALLEQERPNVFTQSVANIPPDATVDVEIHYVQTLTYDAGEYEFVFPTVVGPRYIPGEPLPGPDSGTGRSGDTTRVPDASRISPPILGRGERTGHDIAIEVVAEAGSPITDWAAPMHEVDALATGQRLHVKLTDRDRIPNRDFVLRYRSADAKPVARMFVQPRDGAPGGHFMLVAEPPRLDIDALVGRRELIFVVDVSGSMSGTPLKLAKAAMRVALADLRPVDTFDVFVFSGSTGRLFAAPRPATDLNVHAALQFVDGLEAAGGTEMTGAVEGALGSAVEAGRHRYVFFLTDGETGEEAEITRRARLLVQRQKQEGRRARVFGVAIGSSPNSHLLAQLSRAGDGVPLSIHQPGDVPRTVATFERIIDAPVITDVAVDWGSTTKIDAVYPAVAPDLFASRPLVVHGRYTGELHPHAKIALRGAIGRRQVTFPVDVSFTAERSDVLASLWGRARVDDLDLRRITTDDPTTADETAKEILATGLAYHLVTAYTSLVAVDHASDYQGPTTTVVQPVEVPVDVSVDHAYGASADISEAPPYDSEDKLHSYGADEEEEPLLARKSRLRSLELEKRASRTPSARIQLQGITAATPAAADALRAALDADLPNLDACLASAPFRVVRTLRLTVRVVAGQRVVSFHLDTSKPLDPGNDSCLRERVEAALALAATPPGDLTIELRVWMRR